MVFLEERSTSKDCATLARLIRAAAAPSKSFFVSSGPLLPPPPRTKSPPAGVVGSLQKPANVGTDTLVFETLDTTWPATTLNSIVPGAMTTAYRPLHQRPAGSQSLDGV